MSSVLLPFQEATRELALARLTTSEGTRRFLIADEVGLGKTVVTREILRSMLDHESAAGRALNVFYIANNLNVAAQNRNSLLRVLDDGSHPVPSRRSDRLPLLAMKAGPSDQRLRLYSLTLDTSVPGLRSGNPLGTIEERAKVVALLDRLWPGFTAEEAAYNDPAKSWDDEIARQRYELHQRQDAEAIARRFRQALREAFNVEPGKSVGNSVRAWVRSLPTEAKRRRPFMAKMRTVLALTALSRPDITPDLVILDEFQKFPEILAVRPNERVAAALKDRALRLLVERLLGNHNSGPPVLLLSATPYKMHPAQQSWSDGGATEPLYDDFYRIVEFLNGGGARGAAEAMGLKQDFAAFEHLLFAPPEPADANDRRKAILTKKRHIEHRLAAVMARTERSDDPLFALGQTTSHRVDAGLDCDDLVVFDDFADRLRRASEPKRRRRRKPSRIGMAVPLWTSVPYPMQTLGRGYVAWNDARTVPSRSRLGAVGEIREPKKTARGTSETLLHPKLRALVQQIARPQDLALPWMPPTLAWWRFSGVWQDRPSEDETLTSLSKTLLFSRFRIAPSVISGLVSLEVERHTAPSAFTYRNLPKTSRFRSGGGRSTPGVAAAFFPWPSLVAAIDPHKDPLSDIGSIHAHATRSLQRWLSRQGIEVRRSLKRRRPVWKLAAALEGTARLARHGDIENAIFAGLGKHALAEELRSWREAAGAIELPLSPAEVRDVAWFALGAPGVVLGRALSRHWSGCLDTQHLAKVFRVSWLSLRFYLGHRYFDHALAAKPSVRAKAPHSDKVTGTQRRRTDDVTPLIKAIVAGNLEALLDEQMALWSRVGSLAQSELLDELETVLYLQTGRTRVHSRTVSKTGNVERSAFTIRSHSALPFSDGSDRGASRTPGRNAPDDVKGERLKRAFNSPFWPHMLTTTSMGQEGLDFHLWCRRVVHWDLPTNPVDLEQREGRVSRYAGLSVRAVLAKERGAQALQRIASEPLTSGSPWLTIFAIVDEEAVGKSALDHPGLAPWWVLPGASLSRVVLEMPMSEQVARLEQVLDDVLYYRLALGQPNAKRFVDKARKLGAEEARNYVIDLSSLRLRSMKNMHVRATADLVPDSTVAAMRLPSTGDGS